ncbi:MAG: helix-turn-helix transcriptional regulator [Chloroflexi bacterium]|nr:helix-turn-helix transcriptional regulator [Chloroflexota bacterium]
MRRKRFAGMACPIARTLDVVGEWWTLLIVRDALVGARRFEEFRQTGIADNILSARLDLLVREGIFERRAYQEHPPRHEYLLTDKGQELLPVIVALGMWGLKWTDGPGKAPRILHTRCGATVTPAFRCPTCGEAAPPGEIRIEHPDRLRTPSAVPNGGTGERPRP